MNTFSYSRLSKYITCPASFYRHYILGMREPTTMALALGKAAHATIELAAKLYNQGINSRNVFQVSAEVVAAMSPLKVDIEELINLTYKETVTGNLHPKNIIEEHFTMPLDTENPFSPDIQGHIDVYRQEEKFVHLIDWKTNYKEYSPLDNHQLGLYAHYLNKKTNLPIRGSLMFLRSGNVVSHQYTHEDIENARKWAIETALEIQKKIADVQSRKNPNEIFPVKHGESCGYCGWSKYCADNFLDIPEEIATHDQAKEIAKRIILLESAADNLKSMLKPYVDACGSVRIDEKEFRFVDAGYWRWNIEAVHKAHNEIIQSKKDPFEYFTINSYGLKKLAWSDDKIASFGAKRATSHQFRLVKAVNNHA